MKMLTICHQHDDDTASFVENNSILQVIQML